MENWRRFINEIEFYERQPDRDRSGGGKSVAVFDMETDYKLEGETHGGVSHSIKHYMEFDSSAVQQAAKQAASIVSGFDKVFIKKAGADDGVEGLVAQEERAKQMISQNPNIMLNTFDMINDKTLNNKSLNDSEKKLLPIIKDIFSKYKQLAEKHWNGASDIGDSDDVNQVLELLNSGNPVKFTAKYEELEKIYALDPKNTAIVSYMDGKVSTFFKIDKKGANKQKVVRYFTKTMTIKNPIVLSALQQWAGPEVETPQQQKKQKPQQQKKGPDIRAMAMGMQRGGKSFEEIQAQIKKTTGRDIPVDNIKRMVGAP
jgi:hypothetical protein